MNTGGASGRWAFPEFRGLYDDVVGMVQAISGIRLLNRRPRHEHHDDNLATWYHMDEELAAITGRDVGLVSRFAVERSENFIRRQHILGAAEPIYVEE
jgi:hypothetical protein